MKKSAIQEAHKKLVFNYIPKRGIPMDYLLERFCKKDWQTKQSLITRGELNKALDSLSADGRIEITVDNGIKVHVCVYQDRLES